jgi:hypothetical protein
MCFSFQNDECYFRQFISGFVKIWTDQIELNFDDVKHWETIKPDGPNLNRLPEELLPAIEKFLIIARDDSDQVRSGRVTFVCEINRINLIAGFAGRHQTNRNRPVIKMLDNNFPSFRQHFDDS